MYIPAIWAAISCIFIIVWSLLLWEAWNTSITPDDYDFEDDDLDIEKNKTKR